MVSPIIEEQRTVFLSSAATAGTMRCVRASTHLYVDTHCERRRRCRGRVRRHAHPGKPRLRAGQSCIRPTRTNCVRPLEASRTCNDVLKNSGATSPHRHHSCRPWHLLRRRTNAQRQRKESFHSSPTRAVASIRREHNLHRVHTARVVIASAARPTHGAREAPARGRPAGIGSAVKIAQR